ncbi:MAG: hypothetical protein KC535_00550 [Nanoarchaeota archaeon]|nr:hypothetical protein [Nanoarchaeota archaeon]
MRDFVYVDEGKEAPFLDQAKTFGYEELILIYKKKPKQTPKDEKLSLLTALVNQKGNDLHIVLGTSLTQVPKNAHFLVDNEFDEEKDFVHQRRSGLNHVMLKECKQKGVIILFNLSKLRKQPEERISLILGRMKQNAQLCKKYGVPFELVSLADEASAMRHAKDISAMKRALFS